MDSHRLKPYHNKPPLIIGHRGASGVAPENTLAAFRTAVQLGADGIELDVQLSSDGEPVVIHDIRLDRTTNATGYVSEYTAAQLRSVDAGSAFVRRLKTRPRLKARVRRLTGSDGAAYHRAGEPVPSLAAALELLGVTGLCRIYVEIKGSRRTRAALLDRTLAIVRKLGLEEVVTLLSFDHSVIGRAKKDAPSVRGAITIPGSVKRLPTARSVIRAASAVEADEVALHYSIVSPRLVRCLHQSGLQVSAWTVNRKIIMKRLLGLGVDSIMTNHVDRLKLVIQSGNRRAPRPGARSRPL